MKVPYPNALTINTLGLGRLPFPISVTHKTVEPGIESLHLFPIRATDVADLLERASGDTCIACDGGLHHYKQGFLGVESLAEVATGLSVEPAVFDTDVIGLQPSQLAAFLEGVQHYELKLFDLERDMSEDAILEEYLALQDRNWALGEAVLAVLPSSAYFFHSHDDCYVYTESRSLELLQQIFERMLVLVAGTVFKEQRDADVDIAPIPPPLLRALWPQMGSVSILRDQTMLDGDRLRIGISNQRTELKKLRVLPTDLYATYRSSNSAWALESVEAGA